MELKGFALAACAVCLAFELRAAAVPPPPDPGLEVSVRASDAIVEVEVLAGGPFRAALKVLRTLKGKTPQVFELQGYNSLNGDTVHGGLATGSRHILFLSRTDAPDVFTTLTPSAPRLTVDDGAVMLSLGQPPFRIPIRLEAMDEALKLMLERDAKGAAPDHALARIKLLWLSDEIESRYLSVALAGFLRETRAVPLVIEASKASLTKLRLTAVDALRKIATPEALVALRALVRDPGATVARAAVQALIALEDLADIEGLLSWAKKAVQEQARLPEGDARRKKNQDAVTDLRMWLDRKGALLDPDVVCAPLFELASGADANIAGDALYLLGRLIRKPHVARLIALADDPVFPYQAEARVALLQATLKDEPDLDRIREWWRSAQEGFGEDLKRTVIEGAVKGLRAGGMPEERTQLLRIAGSAPGEIALPSLAPLLMDANTSTLFDASDLNRWQTLLALPFLMGRLGHSSDPERRGAMLGLTALAHHYPRLQPLIRPLARGALFDEYGNMRRAAATAAGLLGDLKAMPQLLDALRLYGAYEADQAAQSMYALSARTMGYGPYEPIPDLEDAAARLSGWWKTVAEAPVPWSSPLFRPISLSPVTFFSLEELEKHCEGAESVRSGAAFGALFNARRASDPFWKKLSGADRLRNRAYGALGMLGDAAMPETQGGTTDRERDEQRAWQVSHFQDLLLDEEGQGDLVRALAMVGLASLGSASGEGLHPGAQVLTTWLEKGGGAQAGVEWRRLATVCLGLADGDKASLAFLSGVLERALEAEPEDESPMERGFGLDERDVEPAPPDPAKEVPDGFLLHAALSALCAREDSTLVLERALASRSPAIRESALRVLGARGHRGSMDTLLEVLERAHPYALGDQVRIVAPLLRKDDLIRLRKMLVRVDQGARLAAAWLLAKRWDLADDVDTRSALIAATRDESDEVRAQAAEALGKLRAREAVPALVGMLEAWDPGLRASAAEALAAIGDPEGCAAAAAVAAGLYSLDTRWIRALGIHGGDDELKMLLRFSRSDRWTEQRVGIDALGLCRRPEALERLLEIFRNHESAFQSHAAAALALQGKIAVNALSTPADLMSTERAARARAIYALSLNRTRAAAEALVAALRDPELSALAVFGLRRLAGGQDAGYDPEAPPAQRAEAAQRWLEGIEKALLKEGAVGR